MALCFRVNPYEQGNLVGVLRQALIEHFLKGGNCSVLLFNDGVLCLCLPCHILQLHFKRVDLSLQSS